MEEWTMHDMVLDGWMEGGIPRLVIGSGEWSFVETCVMKQ
jgi:hypothetical protein